MLIKAQDLKDIQENKVTLVKNFASLTREYDFNLLSNLMEENECIISQKSNVGNLKDVFQIHKISNCLKEYSPAATTPSKARSENNPGEREVRRERWPNLSQFA